MRVEECFHGRGLGLDNNREIALEVFNHLLELGRTFEFVVELDTERAEARELEHSLGELSKVLM